MTRTPLQPDPAPRPADTRRGLFARLDPRSGGVWPWSSRQAPPAPDPCDGYDT